MLQQPVHTSTQHNIIYHQSVPEAVLRVNQTGTINIVCALHITYITENNIYNNNDNI